MCSKPLVNSWNIPKIRSLPLIKCNYREEGALANFMPFKAEQTNHQAIIAKVYLG